MKTAKVICLYKKEKPSSWTVRQVNAIGVDVDDLPPIKTKSYAFSSNKLYKKKKCVRSIINEADAQIAAELGKPAAKKSRN